MATFLLHSTQLGLGEDRSTKLKDYAGSFYNFWDKTVKIGISYKISQQILDRTSLTFQH